MDVFPLNPFLEMLRSAALAFVALVGSATAFAPMASSSLGSLRSRSAAIRPAGFAPSSQKFRLARAPMALRMQSEDDKAKASGVAAAVIGLILSGFSPLIGVVLGGAAVYAGATPPLHWNPGQDCESRHDKLEHFRERRAVAGGFHWADLQAYRLSNGKVVNR